MLKCFLSESSMFWTYVKYISVVLHAGTNTGTDKQICTYNSMLSISGNIKSAMTGGHQCGIDIEQKNEGLYSNIYIKR